METPFEALTILVLCASPAGDLVTLKLSHELARIEKQLAMDRLPIRMRRVVPPTIEQLKQELGNLSAEILPIAVQLARKSDTPSQ